MSSRLRAYLSTETQASPNRMWSSLPDANRLQARTSLCWSVCRRFPTVFRVVAGHAEDLGDAPPLRPRSAHVIYLRHAWGRHFCRLSVARAWTPLPRKLRRLGRRACRTFVRAGISPCERGEIRFVILGTYRLRQKVDDRRADESEALPDEPIVDAKVLETLPEEP